MAASFVSRLAVSPAVNWPLFTPLAMRSCWFSLRCATVGFGTGAVVVVVLCVEVLVEFVSWAAATVPNSSTAAGNTVHFENWKFMVSLLLVGCSTDLLGIR